MKALRARRLRLDTPTALVKFTALLVQDALDGTTAVDVARCALYGVSIQRQLVEASDLEQRLAALELALAERGVGPRRVA